MDEEVKKKPSKKKIILIIVLSVVGVLAVIGVILGIHAYRIFKKPESLFKPSETVEVTENENTVIEPAFTLPPEESTEPDTEQIDTLPPPETEPETTAEVTTEIPESERPFNVLNVMLMGIDAYEDGSSTSGSMPHTDVSIVLAINFEQNTVDVISLQRDTFTTVPGYRGFYKLNGVFNVGGGMDDKNGGFELVCRTAEQWLGGISIPYYYAVDFEAVIKMVDAIGGIDYKVDQPFYSHSRNAHYDRGMQHLDGDAVLGYLRIRREADGLDKSRNTRQRKMLLAIFDKLKKEGKISQIPALLSAAGDGIYTNTNMSQTTALVNFASKLDQDNIRSRAVTGTIKMRYDWAWAFVDQPERVQLIKEVYNINVDPVGTCTVQYENWLHETGFDALKHIRQAEKVLLFVAAEKDKGVEFTDAQIAKYIECYMAYTRLNSLFNDATSELAAAYTGQTSPEGGYTALEKQYAEAIGAAEKTLRETTNELKKAAGYTKSLTYTVNKDAWYDDRDINEVYVDFR
ncbi:MAG: LCP family protein [Clostridia bacterium]|nr:LCP family protein [Clostridia bacterium]